MWWIIIAVVVVGIGFVAVRKRNEKGQSSNNRTIPNSPQPNNGIPQSVDIYKEITGYDKNIVINCFRNIPIKDNYEDIDEQCGYTEIDVLIMFLFPKIYLAYLKYELFRVSAADLEQYTKRLHINIQRFASKNMNGLTSDRDMMTRVINNFIIPAANECMHKKCKQQLFVNRKFLPGIMKNKQGKEWHPKSEIENIEYSLIINREQMEKSDFYWAVFWTNNDRAIFYFQNTNNDESRHSENTMRMLEVKLNICSQIEDTVRFNNSLQKTLSFCEEKANKVIDVTYGKLLLNSDINKIQYYKQYDKIKQTCSSQLSPVVVASCDATLKKVGVIIKQKQDMLDKNNADIAKYKDMLYKIERQMEEELQLQEIRNLNKDISQFDTESDLVKNEENNLEFENMIEDINRMEIEVNERRDFEIQFGEIEI